MQRYRGTEPQLRETMKIKTVLLAAGPVVSVAGAIVYFNPAILTWPVVAGLSLVCGVLSGIATHIAEPA